MIKSTFLFLAVFAFLLTPLGKTAEPGTIAGKWHFVMDTPGGDREIDSLFELSADQVTGKWNVDDKNQGAPVAGTFTDKTLVLEFKIDSPEAGPGTMKIKGKLADDGTMTGDWAFQDYSGSFKAKRVTTEAK